MGKVWVRIEFDNGNLGMRSNVDNAQTVAMLEMAKFALLSNASKPPVPSGETKETDGGSIASLRAPSFVPRMVAEI